MNESPPASDFPGDLSEEEIALRYAKLVRRCARPFFLQGGDGEDLIQEGMLGLLSAIRGFDPARGVPFEAFAELCVRRRIISAVKKGSLGSLPGTLPLEAGETRFAADTERVSDPEELVLARERAREMKSRIEADLSKFEREVARLYLDGLTYDEIGHAVGRNAKSIDNAVQRIRRKLAHLRDAEY
ncbi:MAG: sigma-70 family RNA polymerase sigma factor [Oscillospiraceae bacterium]|nr:sigma-70 family RNA polymerase sigma factor [Oscillospiraceae bacterium]